MYGKMISSKNFKGSFSLLYFSSFALNENPSGKLTFGILSLVLPLQISCIGRNLLSKVMENVAVIDRLSIITEIGTFVFPFFSHRH